MHSSHYNQFFRTRLQNLSGYFDFTYKIFFAPITASSLLKSWWRKETVFKTDLVICQFQQFYYDKQLWKILKRSRWFHAIIACNKILEQGLKDETSLFNLLRVSATTFMPLGITFCSILSFMPSLYDFSCY